MFNNVSEMLTWLIVGWIIWPGSFFVVGIIGESRIPPLWKHQSKSFFPGDLTLPVMWIAMLKINMSEGLLVGPTASIISMIAVFAIEIFAFYMSTKRLLADRKNYSLRAANSPTKIYHDIVGYYVFPFSMIPQVVFYIASHIENRVGTSWSLLWIIIPLVFYIICVAYDIRKGFTADDIKARHTVNWEPIWRSLGKHNHR